jgi:hypothetical protein
MQQLATGLLTSGDNATNFTRYSELASVQQNYLQQMGALWLNNSAFGSGPCSRPRAIGGSQARSGRKAHITSFSSSRTS